MRFGQRGIPMGCPAAKVLRDELAIQIGIPGTNIGPNTMQFLIWVQEAGCSMKPVCNMP